MLLTRCCRLRLFTNDIASVVARKFLHSLPSSPAQGQQFYNALQIANMKQRQAVADRKRLKLGHVSPALREGSNEEVLSFEVQALLDKTAKDYTGSQSVNGDVSAREVNGTDEDVLERYSEIELDIVELSSTGDGLALSPSGKLVYIVPFTVPGDRVLARVIERHQSRPYAQTDFIKIINPSSKRNDAGIGCKYFSTCSGCQLQMLSYDDQLAHKKRILEKAYKNFSGLDPSLIPPIGDTYGSPLLGLWGRRNVVSVLYGSCTRGESRRCH